jgi:tetratricopeptide (TPR) repeat protein
MLNWIDDYSPFLRAKPFGPRFSTTAAAIFVSLSIHTGCVRSVQKVSTDNFYAVRSAGKNRPNLGLRQNTDHQKISSSSESISKTIRSRGPMPFNAEAKTDVTNADVLEQKLPIVVSLLEKVRRDPDNAQHHYELAGVYHRMELFDEARIEYEKALAAEPENPVYNESMGRLWRDWGKSESGIPYLEKALELRPSYVEAWNSLGTVHDELGNFSQARECYLKALEINFDLDFVHNNLCFHYVQAGDLQSAICHGEKAVLLNPSLTQARNNLGVAYGLSGEFGRAIEQFKIVGDEAEAHNKLGVLLLKAKRNAEALEEFKVAVRLKPFYTVAAQNYRTSQKLVSAGIPSPKPSEYKIEE